MDGLFGNTKKEGTIIWYGFERIKLKLADKTHYTPDFFVVKNDGSVEVHEIKGFMRDDAAVKLKVAAEIYPFFQFILIKKIALKDGGGWDCKTVP